jgi:predicted PurR-regulated permease PerM
MSDQPSTTKPDQTSTPDAASDPAAAPTTVVEFTVSARTIWRVILMVLLTLAGLVVFDRARDLVTMLIISMFFALAMVPLVERLHHNRGWKRGAAVGVIYAGVALFIILMVVFLIPMIVNVAQTIGENWSGWIDSANQWLQDTFGVSLDDVGPTSEAGEEAAGAAEEWATQALGGFLGALSTGVGLIFSAMTIALFTFYFAADFERIQRLFLSLFNPDRQERLGWTIDQAIEQTGGYFYSRLILMGINGTGFFFTMVLVGMPWLIALPLAIIAGFISEFIPAVGTYIGGAIPVLMALALQGFVQALIVLAYVLIYQQVENYWLSPKLSAETMTLNGGVAFGAALAGGAIAGPMGAFMALPVAALITSFLTHYRKPKEVVYQSIYSDPAELAAADAGDAPPTAAEAAADAAADAASASSGDASPPTGDGAS